MKESKKFLILLITFLSFIAVFLGAWKIYHPGFNYDEVLFVNAALNGKTGMFINMKIMNVPFLLMEYIGALKAWIYYPIFKLLPFNYWTVRLPVILMGVAGGIALVAALWKGYGRSAAMAGAVMIILDPSLSMFSRLDFGPVALMFLFRGLTTLAIVSWVRTQSVKWACWGVVFAGLGIFDKLNFLWFTTAASVAMVLVYRENLRTFARAHLKATLILSVIAAMGMGIAVTRAIMIAFRIETPWPDRIPQALGLLRLVVSGGAVLDTVAGDGLRLEPWMWSGYLLAIIAGLLGLRTIYRNKETRRMHQWSILTFLLTMLAYIATKSATGAHHAVILTGLWQFILAPMVGALYDKGRTWSTWMTRLALLTVFLASIYCTQENVRLFAFPSNPNWDPANDQACKFAQKHPDATFLTTNWGTGNPLVGWTKDRPTIIDAWTGFTRNTDAQWYVSILPKDSEVYIFTRLPQFEQVHNSQTPGNRACLIYALDSNHMGHQVVATYNNWKNQPMIEIWKLKKN